MTSEEIKGRIKEIISSVSNIPVEEIGDEDHYVEDLNLDSLSLLEIGVDVDYHYRLGLVEEEMRSIINVTQAAELVAARLAAQDAGSSEVAEVA